MEKVFTYNDGGRSQYFKTTARDCVARAIAIASQKDYKEIYDRLAAGNAAQSVGKNERQNKARTGKKTASLGIFTTRKWFKDYMKELGFEWVATMQIGKGCQTHLVADELPMGRLVVKVSKHLTAVIDGVINDTANPSRDGSRCVYGYWKFKK